MRRFPLGWVGTQSKLRVAAGTGAIAVFLLAGGAAIPVVSADPGHSGDGNDSHRGGDSRRGDGDGRQGQGRGGRDRDGQGDGRRGDGPNRSDGHRGYDGGNGTAPGNDTSWNGGDGIAEHNWGSTADGQRTVIRAGADSPSAATPPPSAGTLSPSAGASSTGQVATAAAVPEVPAEPVAGGGGPAAAPVTAAAGSPVTAPPVTIGDRRTPDILTGPADEAPSQAAEPVQVALPTAPLPPAQLPPSTRLDVAPPWQRAVSSLWAAAAPNRPGGLVFGLAGLVLAPLAGVWLGYRQARATRAAAQLIRH